MKVIYFDGHSEHERESVNNINDYSSSYSIASIFRLQYAVLMEIKL